MEFKFEDLKKLEANRDSDSLSNMIDEWAKKIITEDELLKEVDDSYFKVTKELVILRQQVSEKRQEQLDLESIKSKAHYNIRKLNNEKAQISRAFWRSRD